MDFRTLLRRRIRYRFTLGGILFLFALAVTGAGAFLSGNNLVFLIFAAMLALLLISGFLSRLVLSGLELELLLPQHVPARAPTPARIRIRNLKRLTPSFSIELEGVGSSASGILAWPVYFPLVPGRTTLEALVEVVFPRRGRHQDNVFQLSTKFPFGFLRKTTTVVLRRETIVYPALLPQPAMDPLIDSIASRTGANLRGAGTEFQRIRPYEPDDNARHVDWKSTAHTGTLHVREFARDRERTVEICFDSRILDRQRGDFEKLIERCAFVAWNAAAMGAPVLFRTRDVQYRIPEINGIYDILWYLALVEPITVEPMTISDSPEDDFSLQVPSDDSNLLIVFATGVQK